MHICTYAHVYVCVCIHICACMRIYAYVYTCISARVLFMYTCVRVACMRIYVWVHMHIYTHAFRRDPPKACKTRVFTSIGRNVNADEPTAYNRKLEQSIRSPCHQITQGSGLAACIAALRSCGLRGCCRALLVRRLLRKLAVVRAHLVALDQRKHGRRSVRGRPSDRSANRTRPPVASSTCSAPSTPTHRTDGA